MVIYSIVSYYNLTTFLLLIQHNLIMLILKLYFKIDSYYNLNIILKMFPIINYLDCNLHFLKRFLLIQLFFQLFQLYPLLTNFIHQICFYIMSLIFFSSLLNYLLDYIHIFLSSNFLLSQINLIYQEIHSSIFLINISVILILLTQSNDSHQPFLHKICKSLYKQKHVYILLKNKDLHLNYLEDSYNYQNQDSQQ